MIGAVTPGWCNTQASAICAFDTPCVRGQFAHSIDDREIRVLIIEIVSVVIGFRAGGLAVSFVGRPTIAGQKAARQRAPGDDADSLGSAERDHFALFFAIDEIVVILHRDESAQVEPVGRVQHVCELPGKHRRSADIERLAGRTTSSSAPSVSSIGVSGSKRWI